MALLGKKHWKYETIGVKIYHVLKVNYLLFLIWNSHNKMNIYGGHKYPVIVKQRTSLRLYGLFRIKWNCKSQKNGDIKIYYFWKQ